jgi:hypothetical protein
VWNQRDRIAKREDVRGTIVRGDEIAAIEPQSGRDGEKDET